MQKKQVEKQSQSSFVSPPPGGNTPPLHEARVDVAQSIFQTEYGYPPSPEVQTPKRYRHIHQSCGFAAHD